MSGTASVTLHDQAVPLVAGQAVRRPDTDFEFDEAQLAAASFLARYSGRTPEAYRHDLRGDFQWAALVAGG